MSFKKAAASILLTIVSMFVLVQCDGKTSDVLNQVEDNAFKLHKIEADIEALKSDNESEHRSTRGAIEEAQKKTVWELQDSIRQLRGDIAQLKNR
jgi:peptidoglycan hydrolase CwlO-like protein